MKVNSLSWSKSASFHRFYFGALKMALINSLFVAILVVMCFLLELWVNLILRHTVLPLAIIICGWLSWRLMWVKSGFKPVLRKGRILPAILLTLLCAGLFTVASMAMGVLDYDKEFVIALGLPYIWLGAIFWFLYWPRAGRANRRADDAGLLLDVHNAGIYRFYMFFIYTAVYFSTMLFCILLIALYRFERDFIPQLATVLVFRAFMIVLFLVWTRIWVQAAYGCVSRAIITIVILAGSVIGSAFFGKAMDDSLLEQMMYSMLAGYTFFMVLTSLLWRRCSKYYELARLDRIRRCDFNYELYCPVCNYDLSGSKKLRCPECGSSFNLSSLISDNVYVRNPDLWLG